MSRLVLFLTMVCVVDGFSCGARHCCGITAHDSVARCFGKDIWGDTIDIPSTPSYFSSIETSEANACGITVEGTRCYGHDHGYGLLNPPPDPLKKIAMGYNHACGLRVSDSKPVCWGRNDMKAASPPNQVFEDIFAGPHWTCGLTPQERFAVCWGRTTPFPQDVSFSRLVGYCGHLTNHSVWCVADLDVPPPDILFADVQEASYAERYYCGIALEDRLPRCWGNPAGYTQYLLSKLPNVQLAAIAVSRTGAVGLTLAGHCAVYWGGYGNPKPPGYAFMLTKDVGVLPLPEPQGGSCLIPAPLTTRTTTTVFTYSTVTATMTSATSTRTTRTTSTRPPDRFQALNGENQACRGANETDMQHSYAPWSGTLSLADCKARCHWRWCVGVEYSFPNSRCELWRRPEGIQATKPVEGFTCLRNLDSPVFTPVAENSVCRGAHENDDSADYKFVVPFPMTLLECADECRGTPNCVGIEYHRYGRCEVWTRAEGIQASKYVEGYTCLRYGFTLV
ncbi:ACR4 [Symbiodinium microadriaticum]|nr:ACR4 [Symbiodinium microadriaticum]